MVDDVEHVGGNQLVSGEFDSEKACDSCDAIEIMLGKSGEVL